MAPGSSGSGELWDVGRMKAEVDVDILMPNGLYFIIRCMRESTLRTIKEHAWNEAKRYPLQNMLLKSSEYVFVIVTQKGSREEVYDESRRLCDLHLFDTILKLVKIVGNREENELNATIGLIIGKNLGDFDDSHDAELIHARLKFLNVVEQVVEERKSIPYPDLICDFIVDPSELCVKIPPFTIDIALPTENLLSKKVDISGDECPSVVIRKVIEHVHLTKVHRFDDIENYVLRIFGRQIYFLNDVPISNYAYIQECLRHKKQPELQLRSKSDLMRDLNEWTYFAPSFKKRFSSSQIDVEKCSGLVPKSLWDIDEMLTLKVISASYITLPDMDEIFVVIGVYHGSDVLIDQKQTSSVPCRNPRWNEVVEFDLYMKDIPYNAQICFAICATKKRKKGSGAAPEPIDSFPLAWANLRLIDFNGRLISDNKSLHLWSYPKGFEGVLNPLGHNNSNPDPDTACLEVAFSHYDAEVFFPDKRQIREYVRMLHNGFWVPNAKDKYKLPKSISDVTEEDAALVQALMKRDTLHKMSEQEKESLWLLREYCKTQPDSLPRLLDAASWRCRDESAQVQTLLDDWPTGIRFETALELLHARYPDKSVRAFAVKCLNQNTSDRMLYLYLMYLVQVLKYEPFIDNDLSEFLLKRALKNRRIGHLFFWLIKSEAAHALTGRRFHLLLEAYCRGCGSYLASLDRQVKACEKLLTLSFLLKDVRDDVNKFLWQQLNESDYKETLESLNNPLDSSVLLGKLMTEQCRVMSSAKRPLWLVWKSAERPDRVYEVLYKVGDDLRQDMLTLHVMRIMEMIWSSEGENFHLTPYRCLPMGKHVGMIEVVKHAKTILEIQVARGKSTLINSFRSKLLHGWIRENSLAYEKAIERFTLSCAGYCVATFVLGIGDRHSSNIMLTEDGRIFHIDFGHFLGHYKQKFGICRERVPFVLTRDFLCVVAKGADYPFKTKEYGDFQNSCKKAYKILHKNGRWFITLFSMMLCMDLPELQRLEDISYLRRTLAVDKDTDSAVEYFIEQLNLACEGAWTTKIDWFFHSVRHT